MPGRASTLNPVDIGAAGPLALSAQTLIEMGRAILASGEVDALILHGMGQAGFMDDETPAGNRLWLDLQKEVMHGYHNLEQEFRKPVIVGSHHTSSESQTVSELQGEGVRVLHRTDEIAQILFAMYAYWRKADC